MNASLMNDASLPTRHFYVSDSFGMVEGNYLASGYRGFSKCFPQGADLLLSACHVPRSVSGGPVFLRTLLYPTQG